MLLAQQGRITGKRKPAWATKVEELLDKLRLTQAGLAERLEVSPMTISRWVRGTNRPTAETYIKLAALAGPPEESYFLEQAGLNASGFGGHLSGTASSVALKLSAFRLSTSGDISADLLDSNADCVAIPIVAALAHADGTTPDPLANQNFNKIEQILTFPLEWCRNTTTLVGMRVDGDSMMPTIPNGAILIVDTSVTQHEKLYSKIVVASHRDFGLRVAWLQKVGSADILIPDNLRHHPLQELGGKSHWIVIGEVLWWIAKPPTL